MRASPEKRHKRAQILVTVGVFITAGVYYIDGHAALVLSLATNLVWIWEP